MPPPVARMTPAERVESLRDLWDEIAADAELVPLSDEWKTEIDRRWKEYQEDPGSAIPWEEVKARLRASR